MGQDFQAMPNHPAVGFVGFIANLDQCLDFLYKRNAVRLGLESNGRLEVESPARDGLPTVKVIHNGTSVILG